MKAAKSAAIADGVAHPVTTKTALHANIKADPSNASSTRTTPTPDTSQDPKVAAAYAMVAAVNGTSAPISPAVTNANTASVTTHASPALAPISNVTQAATTTRTRTGATPGALAPNKAMLAKTGMTLNRSTVPVVDNPVLGASINIQPMPTTTPAPVIPSATTSAGTAAHMLATNPPPTNATPQPVQSAIPKPNTRPHSSSGRSTASVASNASSKKKGPPLRRGKWTAEEESYANRLIQEFKAGLLPLTDGTTLRTFLSKLLNCDPMRISKKFVGNNCIGKQVFRRRTNDIKLLTPEQIQQSRAELSE